DLPNLVGDRTHRIVSVDLYTSQPDTYDTFGQAVGDPHIDTVCIVGGGSEHVILPVEAESPGIVRGGRHKFERRKVAGEPVNTLAEFAFLAGDGSPESRVSHHAPDMIVEAVFEIRRSGVGVKGSSTFHDDFPDVSAVVAIGILKEKKYGGLG